MFHLLLLLTFTFLQRTLKNKRNLSLAEGQTTFTISEVTNSTFKLP